MHLKKEYFYVIPLLLILFLDPLFNPFPYKGEFNLYHQTLLIVSKLLPFGALAYILIAIGNQNRIITWLVFLPITYFIFLVGESLYLYNSFFQFPHVGLKIMDLFICAGICFYFSGDRKIPFKLLMNIVLAALIIKVAFEPSILSSTAFIQHERGLPSASAFLLLLPSIYFFNAYIKDQNYFDLAKFLILFGFIIFIQHRTVWVATFFAFSVNTIILYKQKKLDLKRVFTGIIPITVVMFTVFLAVVSYQPDMYEKIQLSIDNILNPDSEGTTSEWRLEQFRSYMPFIEKYPIEGMRFKGFELPIQFYNPLTQKVHWEEGTGHHFHSFYFDKLFYFGFLGLFMFLLFMLIPIAKSFTSWLTSLDYKETTVLVFAASGLIYGLGYDLPMHYYLTLGLCWAVLSKKEMRQGSEVSGLVGALSS